MATKLQLQQMQERAELAEKQLEASLYLNATLTRENLASQLGQQFSGNRDLYETLGYKRDPQFADYLGFYERDGIATRLVDAVSDETWRVHPILTEKKGQTSSDEEPNPLQDKFEEMADRLDLWAAFNEVDRVCGFSRFGLIFLGIKDSKSNSMDLSKPVEGNKEIAYVSVHDEGDSSVDENSLEKDPGNPRYGLPNFYSINMGTGIGAEQVVHWSRVIHVKEGRERRSDGYGRFYGVPRLKKTLNRLYDLEKVVGGGSEAFWLLIYRGLALSAKEGYSIPPKDSDERNELIAEAKEYQDKIKRFMILNGMDIKDLGGKPVDSWNQFKVLIAYLSGAERVPQRLLIGSEAGKLASTQDDANWNDYISWRCENFAEPYILRPFLRRMSEFGQFEQRDRYFAFWPSHFQLNDLEEAEVAQKVATAMNQASGGAPETVMPADEFAKRLPGKWKFEWTPEMLAEQAELENPDLETSQDLAEEDIDITPDFGVSVNTQKIKEALSQSS